MDFATVMYLVLIGTMVFCFFVVIFWLAGRDILLALKRKIWKNGCDVYIATKTRSIMHFYKVPKDDSFFKIKDLIYITNPQKIEDLSSDTRNKVYEFLNIRRNQLEKRMKKYELKIQELQKKSDSIQDINEKSMLGQEIDYYSKLYTAAEQSLSTKINNYSYANRRSFFYIEGDPIPKDFFESYSGIDCQILDNVAARAISADPKFKEEIEKFEKIKKLIYAILIGVAVSLFILFKIQSMITDCGCSAGGLMV